MWTSRAGFAGWLLERMRFRSQALEACSRVLKKRAAQSHLSMRVPVMLILSLDCAGAGRSRRSAAYGQGGGRARR